MKVRYRRFGLGIFPMQVVYTNDIDRLERDSDAQPAATVYSPDEPQIVAIVLDVPFLADMGLNDAVSIVAHEASHATDHVLEYIGEDRAGTEIRAYLLQYITKHTLKFLFEDIKKHLEEIKDDQEEEQEAADKNKTTKADT